MESQRESGQCSHVDWEDGVDQERLGVTGEHRCCCSEVSRMPVALPKAGEETWSHQERLGVTGEHRCCCSEESQIFPKAGEETWFHHKRLGVTNAHCCYCSEFVQMFYFHPVTVEGTWSHQCSYLE